MPFFPIIASWRLTGEYGIEKSKISHQEKVQKPAIHRKTDAYMFWEPQGNVM
jgi:hypothetical protein